jgi:ERCC4-type nuclease
MKLDYLCPILVERKAIEDVAKSIHDGRWNAQKKRMYQGQYVFGYENCRMMYVIEGNLNKQEVTGGYVGSFNYRLHRQDIEREIANLESEGFEILRTTSRDQSMVDLARWVKKVVVTDLKSGKLTARYTYAEFIEEL